MEREPGNQNPPRYQVDTLTNTMLAQFPVHCAFRDTRLGQPILHSHRGYELYLCVQGSGRFLAGDRVHSLAPGTLVIVRPMALHLSKPDNKFAFHRFILSVDEAYLAEWCRRDDRLARCASECFPAEESAVLHLSARQAGKLQNTLYELEKELRHKEPFYELSANSLLLQAFVEIARYARRSNEARPEEGSPAAVIEQILSHIAEHYQEDLHMDRIAARFKLSRSYLYRIFKQHTGCALNEFLIAFRINKAKAMLMHTKLPVIEIAARSGFNDISHFCHTFKKLVHTTPSGFRTLHASPKPAEKAPADAAEKRQEARSAEMD
ncbi:AraC family transcriptional regulator [Paenibacillus sp.]|uniref:AraC family transcriptional regulator n=1 Tax=Paenibacillus sp. TaxID=58172 RepID=UPI002811832F|nr:AraC family transcriptional regulator [Paenibacillus sp.]